MSIRVRNRLGPCEITARCEWDGEVYRDRDTRLKREVALKILPEGFATDPEQARFRREAEVLASLSLPNIAAITVSKRVRLKPDTMYERS